MRVVIDWDLCQGHGACEGEAPEVFALDDAGDMTLLQERPPASAREAVEAACRYCPTQAIRIEDDP